VADPVACRRRARQCRRIAQAVRSGEVKQALLGIAIAWVKLAAQADAYEASEPQAPERVDLSPLISSVYSDAPIFFKMVDRAATNILRQDRPKRSSLWPPRMPILLKRHGIVQSRRGKFGGYGLLMPANRITFGQVLRILDGPIAPLPCLSRIAYRRCADCQTEENCEIRRVFAKVAESARDVLDRTTIADAIANSGAPDAAVVKGLRDAGVGVC
jgi:DNA-binding IscR family transcriptional regulator